MQARGTAPATSTEIRMSRTLSPCTGHGTRKRAGTRNSGGERTPAVIRLAVTGHLNLTDESHDLLRAALRELIKKHASKGGLTGLSCIARGADTLFAEEVLAAGGRLIVVLPSRDYRETQVRPADAPAFDRLLQAASEVHIMPYETAGPAAYSAANARLLENADRLIAVWDGRPPDGQGGTADAVENARAAGVAVDVVWPEGAAVVPG